MLRIMTMMYTGILANISKLMNLTLLYFFYIVPSNDDLWIFTSHEGHSFAENAKYQFIYTDQQEEIRAVWISRESNIVNMLRQEGFEAYNYNTFVGKYFALRAGVMFFTHNARCFAPYSGNSKVVQLWHGNMLKKMGNDKKYSPSKIKRLYYKIFGRGWDYFLVTSPSFPAENAKSAYDLSDQDLIVAGYPRTDLFFKHISYASLGIDEAILNEFKIGNDYENLICHFPTWNGGRDEKSRFSLKHIDLEGINTLLNEKNSKLIIKLHPYADNSVNVDKYNKISVISESVDPYPLLKYVDILITDFSSIYFDYLLLDGKVLFYPYDFESYTSKRGLYFDYQDITPGEIAYNKEMLISTIERSLDIQDQNADEREDVRNEFFQYQDGEACKRIYQYIKDIS